MAVPMINVSGKEGWRAWSWVPDAMLCAVLISISASLSTNHGVFNISPVLLLAPFDPARLSLTPSPRLSPEARPVAVTSSFGPYSQSISMNIGAFKIPILFWVLIITIVSWVINLYIVNAKSHEVLADAKMWCQHLGLNWHEATTILLRRRRYDYDDWYFYIFCSWLVEISTTLQVFLICDHGADTTTNTRASYDDGTASTCIR